MKRLYPPWQRRRLRADLPEALFLLAGGLKAGSALPTLLREVGLLLSGVLGPELVQTAQSIGLGASVPQAMDDLASRTREPTLQAVAVATRVSLEVGGNLPAIFERLGQTLLEQQNLDETARAYTLESRISAHIMAAIPVGVLLLAMAINPSYFGALQETGSGRLFMGGCFIAIALGWWVTLRLANVR